MSASPSAPPPPAPADDDELADALAALLQAETAAAAAPPSSEDDLEALKALAGPGWKARLAPAAIAAAVAAAPEPQDGTHGIANALDLDPVRPQMKKLLALNRMTAEEREAKGKQFILNKTKKCLITIGDHIAKAIEEGSIKPCEEKVARRTVREVSKNSLTADKLAEIYRKLKLL